MSKKDFVKAVIGFVIVGILFIIYMVKTMIFILD